MRSRALLVACLVLSARSLAQAAETARTAVTTPLSVGASPELQPSTTDLLTSGIEVGTKSTLVTATFAPFRALASTPSAWGAQVQVTYDSSTLISTYGLAYRVDPRWLLRGDESVVTGPHHPSLQGSFGLPAHAYLLRRSTEKMMASTSFDTEKMPTQAEVMREGELRLTDARGPASADPQATGALATAVQVLTGAKALFNFSPDDPAAGGEPAKAARQQAWNATTNALGNAATVLENLAKSTAGAKACDLGKGTCKDDTLSEASARLRLKDDQLTLRGLLPSLTVGGGLGVFTHDFTQSEDTKQKALARESFRVGLSWRLGNYIEVDGTFAHTRSRTAAVDDSTTATANESGWTPALSLSAGLIFVVPQLLGTSWYDDAYFKTGFQRGVGLGLIWTDERCRAKDSERALCANKGRIDDQFFGAVVDARFAKTVRPRFRLGRRAVERFDTKEQTAIEVSAFFAFVLDAGS